MRLRLFATATVLLMSAVGAAVPAAIAAPATPGAEAAQEAAQEASETAEEAAEEAAENAEETTVSSEEAAAGPNDATAPTSRPGAKNLHRHVYSRRIKRLRRMIATLREQKKVVRALPHTDIRWLVHLPNKRRRIIEYREKIQELRLRAQEVRSRS
jgi:hypothetical protein